MKTMDLDVTLVVCFMLTFLSQTQAQGIKQPGCRADYRGNAPKARARATNWLPGRVWMDLDNALKEGWLSRIVLYIQGAAPNINADGMLVVWRLMGTKNGTWSRVARVVWSKRVRFKHETSRKYEVCLSQSEAPRVTGADRLGWVAINWPFTLAADFDRGGTIPYADVPQDVLIPNMSARFIRGIKQARVSLGGYVVNDKSCLGSNVPYSAEPYNCQSTFSTTSTASSTTSSTTFSTTSPPPLHPTNRTSEGRLMTDPDGSGEQPLVTKPPNRKGTTRDLWYPWSVTGVTTDVTTTRTTVVSDPMIAIYAGAASGGLAVIFIVIATILLVRRKRMMLSKENANLHPKASLRSVHQYEDLGHDRVPENGYDSLTTFNKAAGPFSNVTYTDPDVTSRSGENDATSSGGMTSPPLTSAPLRPSVRSQHVYEDVGAVPHYVEPTPPRNEYLDILPPEENEISSGATLGGATSGESAPGGTIGSNVPLPTYLELIPPDPNEESSR